MYVDISSLAYDCVREAKEVLFAQYEVDVMRVAMDIANQQHIGNEAAAKELHSAMDRLVWRGN